MWGFFKKKPSITDTYFVVLPPNKQLNQAIGRNILLDKSAIIFSNSKDVINHFNTIQTHYETYGVIKIKEDDVIQDKKGRVQLKDKTKAQLLKTLDFLELGALSENKPTSAKNYIESTKKNVTLTPHKKT